MKPITLSPNKQKIIFGVIGILILKSVLKINLGIVQTQSVLNDILHDFGVDVTVSDATNYLILILFALMLVFYFFGKEK